MIQRRHRSGPRSKPDAKAAAAGSAPKGLQSLQRAARNGSVFDVLPGQRRRPAADGTDPAGLAIGGRSGRGILAGLTPAGLLGLQAEAGNGAVAALISGLAAADPTASVQREPTGNVEGPRPVVAAEPAPGAMYLIRKGDTLLGVAGRAYGVGPGAERLRLARLVNEDPMNTRFHTSDVSATEFQLFGGPRISFSPRFAEPQAQLEGSAKTSSGHFAIIRIPPFRPAGGIAAIDAPASITPPTREPVRARLEGDDRAPVPIFWSVVVAADRTPIASVRLVAESDSRQATLEADASASGVEALELRAATDANRLRTPETAPDVERRQVAVAAPAGPAEPACDEVVAWTPTTVEEVRRQLGDQPCHTLHGGRIGRWNGPGQKYPLSYEGRNYQIIVRPGQRRFFGIKYGGGGTLTTQAISWLRDNTEPQFFDETQRHIVDAVTPHVRSEGSISSVNTYDSQLLTLAGRGARSGRVGTLIDNAEQLATHFGLASGDLAGVRTASEALSAESALGSAGARFDMPQIHSLIDRLEQQDAQRAMTLAKLNDAILTFYGRPTTGQYHRDVPAGLVTEYEEALSRDLDDVIVGIAIHLALGEPAYFRNPRAHAIEANDQYRQRQSEVDADRRDYEQLSRQVAYLIKIRVANRLRTTNTRRLAQRRQVPRGYISALMFQKVSDFDTHFRRIGLVAPQGTGFFRVDAVGTEDLIPGWTGNRAVTYLSAPPAGDRLYLKVGPGSQYLDFGQPL